MTLKRKLKRKELKLNRNLLPFMLAPKSPQLPEGWRYTPSQADDCHQSNQYEAARPRLKGAYTDNHL